MSTVPGDKSIDPKIHFDAGLKDLTRFDKVRVINIGGSIQYGLLYSIVYFAIGIGLHYVFPPLIKSEPLLNIFFWIILQSIVIIILSFYAEKLVEMIPGIFSVMPKWFNLQDLIAKGFVPYGVDEFKGNMASSIILIGTQYRLLNKIEYFTSEFSRRYL